MAYILHFLNIALITQELHRTKTFKQAAGQGLQVPSPQPVNGSEAKQDQLKSSAYHTLRDQDINIKAPSQVNSCVSAEVQNGAESFPVEQINPEKKKELNSHKSGAHEDDG